jgi:hypothetical protein
MLNLFDALLEGNASSFDGIGAVFEGDNAMLEINVPLI